MRAAGDLIDPTVPGQAQQFLAGLGVSPDQLRALGGPAGVARLKAEGARADCEVGAGLAGRLRLPEEVGRAILDAFERYDGNGVPGGRAGDEITLAARFAAVGFTAVMFDAVGGAKVAAQTVAQWSGRALDPAVTRSCCGPVIPMTCGRQRSTASRSQGGCSVMTRRSMMPWPGSGTRPT